MIDDNIFMTGDSFSELIEEKVRTEGFTYFQAIIDFSEENDKCVEELVKIMPQVLLEKIKRSARDSGLIDTKEPSLDDFT